MPAPKGAAENASSEHITGLDRAFLELLGYNLLKTEQSGQLQACWERRRVVVDVREWLKVMYDHDPCAPIAFQGHHVCRGASYALTVADTQGLDIQV